MVSTEPINVLLAGEIHSTGYACLTTLLFLFLMKVFDNFLFETI